MSYQPAGSFGYPPQPAPVAPSTSSARRPGRVLFWLGVAVLVLGLAGGGTLIGLSTSAIDDTVGNFARAPQGCTTTLQFDHTGSFTLFFERRGHIEQSGGDCDANASSYNFAGDVPTVSMSLVDESGDAVTIENLSGGASYDTSHYEGEALARVRIDRSGAYELSVSAAAGVFAVAVGDDPEGDRNLLLGGGVIAVAVGLAGGITLIAMGRSRRRHSSATFGGSPDRPMIPVAQYPSTPFAPGPYTPVPAPGMAGERPRIPVTPTPAPAPSPTNTWAPPQPGTHA